jgi:ribosomal protein L20A (L18A)
MVSVDTAGGRGGTGGFGGDDRSARYFGVWILYYGSRWWCGWGVLLIRDCREEAWTSEASGHTSSPMAGRHRLKRSQVRHSAPPQWAVEVVDARTLMGHLLTLDALAAGRLAAGRYIALCREDVLPARLTEPGMGRCPFCVWIPRQQAGST